MEAVTRALIMYFFLLFIVRITGKRTLSEMTVFDFVLILIIGDASQQGITGPDYSIINTVIIISTLVLLDVILSYIKSKSKRLDHILDGMPLIVVHNGKCIDDNLKASGVTKEDILESARQSQGLKQLAQIQYAVLEKSGVISIIPYTKTLEGA